MDSHYGLSGRFEFTAIGKSPLLTHNPASMTKKPTTGKGARAESNIPTPDEEAKLGLYTDEDGRYCVPGIGFRNGFIRAAGAWRGSWQKKRETLKGLVSHCVVVPELVPILVSETLNPVAGYSVDSRRAVVQRQGIIRSRPRFEDWSATFSVLYDESFITADPATLRELFASVLKDAGNRLGVGDYRPEKGGWFGRFSV